MQEIDHNSNSDHYNISALQIFAYQYNDKEIPRSIMYLVSYPTQDNLLLPETGSMEKQKQHL